MSYVVCRAPAVRIDVMVKKKYYPQLLGYFRQTGCAYKKEYERKIGNGEEWMVLKDISSENGRNIGNLLVLFCTMDWQGVTEGNEDKFYVLVADRKGRKKYAGKNWKKVRPGSNKGTAGGSAGDIRHEERVGADRDDSDVGNPGSDDLRVPEDVGSAPGDGSCE